MGSILVRVVIAAAALLVPAVTARSSTLDLVRKKLMELRGTAAVVADIEVDEQETGGKKAANRHGKATIDCDAETVRVSAAVDDLVRAGTLAGRDSVTVVDVNDAWRRLNAAAPLLRDLAGAEVVSEQPATWKGQPAIRLELKLHPPVDADTPRALKLTTDVLESLWVTTAGVPVAADSHQKVHARFLVISANAESHEAVEYALAGDRLIVITEHEESTSEGMGEHGHQVKTTRVTLRKN